MDSMAEATGVSVSVLRFLPCFVATIPLGFVWRFIPGHLPKHLYSAATGTLLYHLCFGFSSDVHFLVPMSLGYASMYFIALYVGLSPSSWHLVTSLVGMLEA